MKSINPNFAKAQKLFEEDLTEQIIKNCGLASPAVNLHDSTIFDCLVDHGKLAQLIFGEQLVMY